MVHDDMTRRARSFEHGAQAYDQLRPGFPQELFRDIADVAGSRLHQRVLEVGAGTGLATIPLARLASRIDVVEPSQDMMGVLEYKLEREKLTDKVSLQQARFEDVAPDQHYDVVVAAQSFHWTDPASRWTRLSSLIRPDGVAFLFWNGWLLDPDKCDARAVADIYKSLGDGLQPDLEDHRSEASWAEDEIDSHAGLGLVATRTYEWKWELPATDYTRLLGTTSQYAVANQDTRDALFDALRSTLGSTVQLKGKTLCVIICSDS